MDARHFDALSRALAVVDSRRRLLAVLATLPLLGGMAAFLAPDDAAGKGRRQRRKKRHKHGKGRRQKHKPHQKKPCKPQPKEKTCAGKCGSVPNNCRKRVDCGPCTCDPPCGACERCTGTTCAPCSPCCQDACCEQENAICHEATGACCVPEPKATTCEGQCGPVVNNCGVTVACGSCVCDPVCPTCQICDEDTGACDADPDQEGDPCGPAQSCDQGTRTPRGSCNASGTCVAADPVSCAPYARCDGNACATTCTASNDCTAGNICDESGQCVPPLANGQSCSQDAQCNSGHCVDGVCCDTACDGVCQACNLSGKKGTCSTEANGAACGSGDVCCGGACQACCTNAQCSNPEPICVVATCAACSETNPCPGGQRCCGGSCFSGICCAAQDCAPTGNTCTGHQCQCGSGGACGFPSPDCCGAPGGCTNTRTDNANCGACGTQCGAGKTCYQGACCTPTTCTALGKTCGTLPDGCGGWLECGGCPQRQVCDEGTCQACDVCDFGCSQSTVMSAVQLAPDGGTVRICPGTYTGTSGLVANILKNLTLVGAGVGPNGTTFDGEGAANLNPPVRISGALIPGVTVALRDLIVTGGNSALSGGGLSIANANVTLTRVFVKGNIAPVGAGILVRNGSLTLNATVITENSNPDDGRGAGMEIQDAAVTLNALSSISGNTGDLGGGIFVIDGSLTMNAGSSVEGNTVSTAGGGIYTFSDSTVTMRAGSSITGNRAEVFGGGIYNGGGTVVRDPGSVITNNLPDNCQDC